MILLRTIAVLCAALAAFTAATSRAADEPARRPSIDSLFGDETLAQGKGVKITSSQLDAAFLSYKANLAARGERIRESERVVREAQLLDRLIVTHLLTNRATAADFTNAVRLEERFMSDARKSAPTDEAFARQLRAMSLTAAQFHQRVREQAVAEAVIEREVKSTIPVSDADVQDLYRTGTDYRIREMQADLDKRAAEPNSKPADIAALRERIDLFRSNTVARLEQPERVRVLHVFIATREREAESEINAEQKKLKRAGLEKVRARALAGEDFAKLVLEVTEDRGVGETKGEYTFSRQDPFSPEFKAAAFSLEPGKISDIVTTPYGMHLVKLLEKIPAQKVEFDKVAGELREALQQQSLQKTLPEYFERVKKEAGVEILEPKYRIDLKGRAPIE